MAELARRAAAADAGGRVPGGAETRPKPEQIEDRFEKTGWSANVAQAAGSSCESDCDEASLVKRLGRRIIGVHIEGLKKSQVPHTPTQDGWTIAVWALDSCWNDYSYECS